MHTDTDNTPQETAKKRLVIKVGSNVLTRDVQREKMRRMYGRYVGPYEFYHTGAISDVMDSFAQFPKGERLSRMEMLAELYYAEAGMVSGPSRDMLLEKALALFGFIDTHSRTYSLDRLAKIGGIKRSLSLQQ